MDENNKDWSELERIYREGYECGYRHAVKDIDKEHGNRIVLLPFLAFCDTVLLKWKRGVGIYPLNIAIKPPRK